MMYVRSARYPGNARFSSKLRNSILGIFIKERASCEAKEGSIYVVHRGVSKYVYIKVGSKYIPEDFTYIPR